MALFTAESVKANIRNLEGRRVFYLAEGDRLTPGARDYLQQRGIPVLPPPTHGQYRTLEGELHQEKPEEMTHLNAQVLVPKTHPRIAFRGTMDSLEAGLLLAGKMAKQEGFSAIGWDLQEALDLARQVIAWDVLEEPAEEVHLGGMGEEELRQRSQLPQKFYGQSHFMPDFSDSWTLLLVNRARTQARRAELACVAAFQNQQDHRLDLVQILNRLSSFLWILEIRLKSGKEGTGWKYYWRGS